MTLKERWRVLRPYIVSGAIYRAVCAVGATLRVQLVGWEKITEAGPAVLIGWHGRSFLYAYAFRNKRVNVIISQSKDGDIQTSIFTRLGYRIIRGSTGRGGVRAAVQGIRALREGGTLAMTPDGPRGPTKVLQMGPITMAQKSGTPVIPVGVSASPRTLLPTWDRYMIPAPFAKGIMIVGNVHHVPATAGEDELEAIRREVEAELNALEKEAEQRMGYPPSAP